MSEPQEERRHAKHARPGLRPQLFVPVLVLLLIAVGLVVAAKAGVFHRSPVPPKASPVHRKTAPSATSPPASAASTPGAISPSPAGGVIPAGSPGPINPNYLALTTFRGNWARDFSGIGPVPKHPQIQWKTGPWCARSVDLGKTATWCGTGWNGTPNVIPQPKGGQQIRVGGYDDNYHFLDGYTGKDDLPLLHTGDLAKGSATSDPQGYPLYYAGSRDNKFRIVALDRSKPAVLWSMNADTSVPDPRWNNDWDGAAQIVGDYMLEGGENSWFYVVKLNRGYDSKGLVTVDPKIVFKTPGWDAQLLKDVHDGDISIEDSVAYNPANKTAYFGNSGGLVQGWDLSRIFNGGTEATRTFRFWTGGENDPSIVIDPQGDLIVSEHYKPSYPRAEQIGQIMKLDPSRPSNPVVWSIKESTVEGTDAGFFSTPALVGNIVYASSQDGKMMAINEKTGKTYWTINLAAPLWSGPVVVDDTLVIGDCSGTIYGFDVSKTTKPPKKLWSIPLGGCIETTPAVWNGWIYVGTRAGYEYGLADKHWKREQQPVPLPSSTPIPGPKA